VTACEHVCTQPDDDYESCGTCPTTSPGGSDPGKVIDNVVHWVEYTRRISPEAKKFVTGVWGSSRTAAATAVRTGPTPSSRQP
jgi:hypothetical protein